MKCLIVVIIAALAFVAADEEWKMPNETPAEIDEKCLQESGVTKEQRAKMTNFEAPDEKEIHEYFLCSVKKFGVFTEDSGFHTDRLLTLLSHLKLDAEKTREIVTKCVDNNEQKSTPAVWAFRGVECMKNNKIDELFKEAQDRMKNNKVQEV